jgi:hypothetical protein
MVINDHHARYNQTKLLYSFLELTLGGR